MNDPVGAARSARQNLAQGLAALQGPGVPEAVMVVAEPVAQAMSALHQIEVTQGAAARESGPVALDAVRRALSMLQAQPIQHPAVGRATECVAGSLGELHQLNQMLAAAPVAPGPMAGSAANTFTSQVPKTQPSAPDAARAQAPAHGAGAQAQFGGTQVMPQGGYLPQAAHPAQAQYPAAQYPAAQPQQATAQPAAYAAQGYTAPLQKPPAQYQPAPAQHPPAAQVSPKGTLRVEAELGAHSATNFYKGLSGNDVIDSGGIFIATYQIQEIGRELIIKISLPGGYEFEAGGVVRWTRDAPSSGVDAPPGYGAQLTQISPEGRQLVYRYVRNREPLFHDDL